MNVLRWEFILVMLMAAIMVEGQIPQDQQQQETHAASKPVISGSPNFEQMEQRIRKRGTGKVEISDDVLMSPKEVNAQLQGASLSIEFKNVTRGMSITRKGVKPLTDPVVVVNLPGAVVQGTVSCHLLIDSLDLMARDLTVAQTLYVHGELEAVDINTSDLVFVDETSELKALAFYKSSFKNGIGFYNCSLFACFDTCKIDGQSLLRVDGKRRKLRFNLSNSEVGSAELFGQGGFDIGCLSKISSVQSSIPVRMSTPNQTLSMNTGSQMSVYTNKFSKIQQRSIDSLKNSINIIAKENNFN